MFKQYLLLIPLECQQCVVFRRCWVIGQWEEDLCLEIVVNIS